MTRETYNLIQNHLEEGRVYPRAIYDGDFFYICLEIRGDWKHDHLRADYLMKQIGYEIHHEEVTESDGSDFYGATRYYVTSDLAEAIRVWNGEMKIGC